MVFFDALGTLITPRRPIHVQYAEIFDPYLGKLESSHIQDAFKKALKEVQRERPVFAGGADSWWKDVIRRTAVGAGAHPQAVDASLTAIVPKLMQRFSGSKGYKYFDDVVTTLELLKANGMRVTMLSNGDIRMSESRVTDAPFFFQAVKTLNEHVAEHVLVDLGLAKYFDFLLVSEDLGNEKPTRQVWIDACLHVGVGLGEVVHVGDELECDYNGAKHAGVHALLVRRPGSDGNGEWKEPDENLTDVRIVKHLSEVVAWIARTNRL